MAALPVFGFIGSSLVFLLFCSNSGFANDWKIKSDFDSEGPRCVLWTYSPAQNEMTSFEHSRISYFTILSLNPLLTEFAYKFPKTTVLPENIRVITQLHGYPLKYQDGYAWTLSKKADNSLIQEILNEKEFEVRFTLNGREVNDRYSLYQISHLLKELSEQCKMKL